MQLTKNFTLEELLRSEKASQLGFVEQFTPPGLVIANLTQLAIHVLQPIRDFLGNPVKVNSGYRCPRLNAAIGGAKTSQHLEGRAADLDYFDNWKLLAAIKASGVVFDQCIVEHVKDGQPSWIHVSYSSQRRGEILEAYIDKGITKYRRLG